MDETAVDERLRTALADQAETTIEVDVDAAWIELVERLEARPPRGFATRWVAAAAVVLLALAIGRPAVVDLAGEVANFGRFVEEVVVPAPAGDGGGGAPDPAHDPVPEGDSYRQDLRRVHDQLNAAIGHGRRDLDRLAGADRVLGDLLGQRPELDDQLRETITQLRRAEDNDDRGAASRAHTLIEDLEVKAAAR